MSDLDDFLQEQLKDPEFARAYDALIPEHELADSLIGLRTAKGLTQKELADRVGTKQSSISRLESMDAKPSLRFLGRVAAALDAHVIVGLVPKMEIPEAPKIRQVVSAKPKAAQRTKRAPARATSARTRQTVDGDRTR